MQNSKTKIELPNGDMLVLRLTEIDEEVDLDRLTIIDMSNLAAELITIAPLMNKFGLLVVDMEEKYATSKLNLEIQEAKIKQQIRDNAMNPRKVSEEDDDDEEDEHLPEKVKKAIKKQVKLIPVKKLTNDEVDMKLVGNSLWQAMKKKVIKTEKELGYIKSTYWAIKEKALKLDKVSQGLSSGDVLEQLVESKLKRINFVNIDIVKSKIK